jgi:hypothetical protein
MDLQPPLLSCLKRFTGAKPHHGSSTVRLLRALVPSRGGAENIRTTLSLSLCVCTPLFLYNFVLSPSLNDGVCEGNTVFFYTII